MCIWSILISKYVSILSTINDTPTQRDQLYKVRTTWTWVLVNYNSAMKRQGGTYLDMISNSHKHRCNVSSLWFSDGLKPKDKKWNHRTWGTHEGGTQLIITLLLFTVIWNHVGWEELYHSYPIYTYLIYVNVNVSMRQVNHHRSKVNESWFWMDNNLSCIKYITNAE